MVGPALFLLVWIVTGLLDPHYSFRTGHGGTVVFLVAGSEPGDPLYPVSGLLQLVLVGVGFAWLVRLAVRFDRRPVADRTTAALQPGGS